MSLYDDLEVDEDATEAEIKSAFKKQARKHHPDKGGDAEEFKQIQKAYNVLRDSEKRKRYDSTGESDNRQQNRAEQSLASLFAQLIDEDRAGDMVEQARDIVKSGMTQANQKMEAAQHKIKKIEAKMGRIVSDNDDNIYEGVLSQALRGVHNEIDKYKDIVELGKETLELLEHYTDSKPKERPPHGEAGTGWTTMNLGGDFT